MPTELIQGSDTLNQGRIKLNERYSGQTNIWSSSTGAYSIIAQNYTGNFTSGSKSVVLGHSNISTGNYSSILGGTGNTISGLRGIIVGGAQNVVAGTSGLIGGGTANRAGSTYSMVVNGANNSATTQYATVVNGKFNLASATNTFIGGGKYNTASTTYSVIVGGSRNSATGTHSFVGGGIRNSAFTGSYACVVGGGYNLSNANHSFVGGGRNNSASTKYSAVVGGRYNGIIGTSQYSFIGAGGGKDLHYGSGTRNTPNIISGTTGTSGLKSAIIAGANNINAGKYCLIGAGGGQYTYYSRNLGNVITLDVLRSAIISGSRNVVSGTDSIIGAGDSNSASSSNNMFIGSGQRNWVSSTNSGIMSGVYNRASGQYSSVIGGRGNHAANISSVAMGGGSKTRNNFDIVIGGTSTNSANVNNNTITLSGITGDIAIVGTVQNGWADYAEYFEWNDGNPSGEDRVGFFVSLNGEKITIGNSYIIGVVSATPGVVGDSAALHWNGMHIRDEWNRRVLESYSAFTFEFKKEIKTIFVDKNGKKYKEYPNPSFVSGIEVSEAVPSSATTEIFMVPKMNPEFSPDLEYTPRTIRKEWAPVGLLGKLYVRTAEVITGNFVDANSKGLAVNGTKYRVLKTIKSYKSPYGIVQILFR